MGLSIEGVTQMKHLNEFLNDLKLPFFDIKVIF